MRLVQFMVLSVLSLIIINCALLPSKGTNLNTKLNEAQTTEDSMAKLKAQGCGIDQLALTKIVKIADQQYAEYSCTTEAGTVVKVYKMNDKYFILSED